MTLKKEKKKVKNAGEIEKASLVKLNNAFDILISFFKVEMKRLIDQNDFEKLTLLKSYFDQLINLQWKIESFLLNKGENENLTIKEKMGSAEKTGKTDLIQSKRGRKPKDSNYKPINAYRFPILKILVDANGKAPVKEILKKLEEMFKDEFSERDKSILRANKEIFWRHNAKICRSFMIRDGLLAEDAPWGYWVLTPKGREEYEKFLASK